ncbi:hypothetical protein [Streptomyces corynorhini]|uniref:Uncharacterized protein n=1 Tax=Streptomyces corynorhini TaxID=2282652 RepID=A0A370AYM1_9ACTN|nr:hypothetical protein [Streptomyces corynorhini]RDG34670.1 hypothetical protein DVH02_29355 [Streptomyces corynorhini]
MKKSDLLKSITEMESTVFRVGQVARQFLADQPRLARVATDITTSVSSGHGHIKVDVASLDDVLTWSSDIGVEPDRTFHQYPSGTGFEFLSAQTMLHEVEVCVAAVALFYTTQEWEARLVEAGRPEVAGRPA